VAWPSLSSRRGRGIAPAATGRPEQGLGAREERVTDGPASRGAQVAMALRISGPDLARKVGRIHGSGIIGK
jgi:hypothetical protein